MKDLYNEDLANIFKKEILNEEMQDGDFIQIEFIAPNKQPNGLNKIKLDRTQLIRGV